jgi:hypothetical protein
MPKLIAITCVITWSGFWAFGYIALTTEIQNSSQMTTAALLAFAGLISGVAAYFKLAQHSETTGYSARSGGGIAYHKNNGSEIA